MLTTSALFALLCFLGVVAIAFSTITLIVSLVTGPPPASLLEACCGTVLARLSIGWLLFAAVGFAAIFVLTRTARSLWRLRSAARRIEALRGVSEPARVEGVACRVYEDPRPMAFCAGLLRPEIFVSRGAVERMSRESLAVVMAHEEYHRLKRDPLRRAIAGTLADGFFFLPILRQVGQKYLDLAEVAADRAAAGAVEGGARDVAGALVEYSRSRSGPSEDPVTTDRLDHLAGERGAWTPNRSNLVATLVILACLLSAPIVSIELLTSVPVGIEALGLHICLLLLTMTPMALAAVMTWSRPRIELR